MVDWAVGKIGLDIEELGRKSDRCHKEIRDESKKLHKFGEFLRKLEAQIKLLEETVETQQQKIHHLKNNMEMLDINACRCRDHLLSPGLHGLEEEEGLEYSTDNEYVLAPSTPAVFLLGTPPGSKPSSDLEDHVCPSPFNPHYHQVVVTSFGCDIMNNIIEDSETEEQVLENEDAILIMTVAAAQNL